MTHLSDHLTDDQKQQLNALANIFKDSKHRADRIIGILSDFLLDDEQQQILGLTPWNIYFLSAGSFMSEESSPEKMAQQLQAWTTDRDQIRILTAIFSAVRNPEKEHINEPLQYNGQSINLPLIKESICLALALDLTHPTTAQTVLQNLVETEQISFDEFLTCFGLSTAGPHPFLPGTIRLRITCSRPSVHQVLKHHETRVQKMLHQANTKVSPRFLYSDIIFEIAAQGYTPMDMKFSVDSMAALKLLTGNRLYSDQRVFLRELVQNAVDACNLKRIFEPDHNPEIAIQFDPEYKTIRFKDNGIGMDRQWIEKYFLKVGISFYQSGDLKTLHKSRMDCHFISKFGIGFLSSFLAADQVEIRTRKNNGPGMIITIHTLEDYFDVKISQEPMENGTEVILFLSPSNISFSRNMDYVCYLKNNLRFLSIPVTLTDHQARTSIIGKETFPYEITNRTGRDFVAPLKFKDAEGHLFLKAKKATDTLYGLDYARGGISIFQDGIFVTQTDNLLPEGARQNIIGRINLIGEDRCELSMDRNRIFWTDEQLASMKKIIRTGIVDLVNMVICEPEDMIDQSLINHLAIFFDFNEIDDAMYSRLDHRIQAIIAKRFRDFIRINFAHTQHNSHVPEADGYAEDWQQEILDRFRKRSRPPL
ncbi:MAG: ATP-binding protein [Desulfobacterales bacterium]|nr:ATP-binding protein [Desulfobacterales bacterium]